MNKKFSRNSDRYDDEDVVENFSYKDELRDRRKQKRMRNALRTNNVVDLMDLDEDY